jgi:acetylornithine deacetylase
MKGGLAASILAVERLAGSDSGPPEGDVLVAGVIDEEWLSAGAQSLVDRLAADGRRIDGAVLPETTGLELVVEHGGFAWWELVSTGAEAAGDDPERGIDAIALLGLVLSGLLDLDAELAARPRQPYGRPNIHASTIAGGSQLSAYPGSCVVGVERCTIPGETIAAARAEVEAILDRAAKADGRLNVALRTIVEREAMLLERGETIVTELAAAAAATLGSASPIRGDMGWMDSGILAEAAIPCVAFGPTGDGEHTAGEWVELASVAACADVLATLARSFCR